MGSPVGSGADYTIAITGCKTGTVGLYLNAKTVADAELNWGPAGPIIAAKVTIDTSLPKAVAPKPSLRTGLQLESSSTAQRLLMGITWSGTDTGSGVASYDVQRSYGGGAYETIASATTATSLDWTMTPGPRLQVQGPGAGQGRQRRQVDDGLHLEPEPGAADEQLGHVHGHVVGWVVQPVQRRDCQVRERGGSQCEHEVQRPRSRLRDHPADHGRESPGLDRRRPRHHDRHPCSATTLRQVVFSKAWSSYASHTIKLVVVGTDGRPRVDLDAFEVIH